MAAVDGAVPGGGLSCRDHPAATARGRSWGRDMGPLRGDCDDCGEGLGAWEGRMWKWDRTRRTRLPRRDVLVLGWGTDTPARGRSQDHISAHGDVPWGHL